MFYFQKRDKAVQQVQSKEEVEPVDEDFTKLKTPNTTESSDYKILRSRKGKIFATECVCAVMSKMLYFFSRGHCNESCNLIGS